MFMERWIQCEQCTSVDYSFVYDPIRAVKYKSLTVFSQTEKYVALVIDQSYLIESLKYFAASRLFKFPPRSETSNSRPHGMKERRYRAILAMVCSQTNKPVVNRAYEPVYAPVRFISG
jgi:hypothetical protein